MKYSHDQICDFVKKQPLSKLNVIQFCNSIKISKSTFYKYRKIVIANSEQFCSKFIQIDLPIQKEFSTQFEIKCKSFSIITPQNLSHNDFQNMIKILMESQNC